MKIIGPSVKEIRIHEKGESRVVYVAGFPEAVYILHAFRKKTRKTAGKDIDLAKKRYQSLLEMRKKS